MTLAEVTFPVSREWARGNVLVFSTALANRLAELHAAYGTANCHPVAGTLTDGRRYLHADVLTEVLPGGLLHAMWSAADQAVLFGAVNVMALAEAAELLPQPPVIQP